MPRSKRHHKPRRRRGLFGLAASWLLVIPPMIGAVGVTTRGLFDPLTATFPGWLSDQAAALASVWVFIGIVALVVSSIGRRFLAGLTVLVALLVLLVALLEGERARRTSDPVGPVVRVLVCNAWSSGRRGDEQLDMILDARADVVMLNEASTSLLSVIRTDPRVKEVYPYFRLPDRAGPGFRFVLSRHPIERDGEGFGFLWPDVEEMLGYHGARILRVTMPEGPFVFAGVQFRSPRSPERWAAGNGQAADTARGIRALAEHTRLPVVVAGDLNASPLGVRSRSFARESGLLRVKPALLADGTYPASLPWPARVPIDGALVSPGIRVVSFRTIEAAGSDHRAVLIELELPSQAASSSSAP